MFIYKTHLLWKKECYLAGNSKRSQRQHEPKLRNLRERCQTRNPDTKIRKQGWQSDSTISFYRNRTTQIWVNEDNVSEGGEKGSLQGILV